MATTQISRHARIDGICPVCLYPLQGRNITQRPCKHRLCTPCYDAGVGIGLHDASFNPDACEHCRDTPCTKTRQGSTLMEHFAPSKALAIVAAPATTKKKKKATPRGPRPRLVGPSAGSAGDAGAEKRVLKKSKKRKAQEGKEGKEDGGFALFARGRVRREGFFVPVGDERTCLPDALYAAMRAANPSLELKQGDVRSALAATASADPSFSMAKEFAAQYGMQLQYEREINNPAALFRRRQGAFLAQLQISTAAGTDNHYVAYLAAEGYVIDNEASSKVPVVDDSERVSNKQAIKVFKQHFPRASSITLRAVSSVFLPSIWSMPTPPTLEDMFLELYCDKVITKEEYLDTFKLKC
jgi:hypothetical protein